MLHKLNERIQGFLSWLVIGLVAVTFTVFGVDYVFQQKKNNDVKVEVDGKAISMHDFEMSYRRNRQFNELTQLTAEAEKQRKQQILNGLIQNLVRVESAKKQGFLVTLDQANSAIYTIPQFQEDGKFSSDRFRQALSNAFYTAESFQKEVQQGMLLNQQKFAFMGTAFALPEEVQHFVKLFMQKRDYEYLLIPAAAFKKQIQVTESEIQNYYQQHKASYLIPEQVKLEYLSLSMHDLMQGIKVNESELHRVYDENKANYKQAAQWKLAHILIASPQGQAEEQTKPYQLKAEQLADSLKKNPAGFEAQLAQSDDKVSAVQHGELPWISAGQTPLDAELSNLTKPGQVAGPIRTPQGFEIYKVLDYRPARERSFEEVQPEIRQQLMADQSQAEFARAMEQLADLTYQSPDSLVPAAEALKLKLEETAFFPRSGGTDTISKNPQVLSAAFSQDVYDQGNNSNTIQFDNDRVLVIRVKNRKPAQEQSLATVATQIRETILNEKAVKAAKNLALQLLADKPAATEASLLAKHQLHWKAVSQAAREGDKSSELEQINELAFALPKPGASQMISLENGDAALVKLRALHEGQYGKLDKEQIAGIAQQLEASYGVVDYDLYINSLMAKAKIENPQ